MNLCELLKAVDIVLLLFAGFVIYIVFYFVKAWWKVKDEKEYEKNIKKSSSPVLVLFLLTLYALTVFLERSC